MQKTLRPLMQYDYDQFADNSEENAKDVDTSMSSVSIGGRPLCNLRFADNINLLVDSKEEFQQLNERLEKSAADYGMEISYDNCKIIVNSIDPRPSTNIRMNGNVVEEMDQFKCSGLHKPRMEYH